MNRPVRSIWSRQCQMAAFSVAAFALILSDTMDVMAQGRNAGRRGDKPKVEQVSITGTLHSMVLQRGVVRVVTKEEQPWQVQLTDTTDVRVNGEGGPELLRPGLFVRFYGKLTRMGKGVEPVKELTVVTPDAGFRPGIFEEEDEEAEEEEKEKEDIRPPGEKSGDGAASPTGKEDESAENESAFGSTTPDDEKPKSRRSNARRHSRSKKPRTIAARRYWISGQLRSRKKGKLVVYAGEKSVRVEVDETTRVIVEAKDLRLARAGDHVSIRGSYYADRPGFAKAYKIEVTLAKSSQPDGGNPTDIPKKRDPKKNRVKAESKKINGKDGVNSPEDSEKKGAS